MNAKEQAVRDAAAALKTAIDEARASGLHIDWPHSSEGLPGIAISDTAKSLRTAPAGGGGKSGKSGFAIFTSPGQPLDLTDEERAALPALEPDTDAEMALGSMASEKPKRGK